MSYCAVEHDLNIYYESQEGFCDCEYDCSCLEDWESREYDYAEAKYDNYCDELERECA